MPINAPVNVWAEYTTGVTVTPVISRDIAFIFLIILKLLCKLETLQFSTFDFLENKDLYEKEERYIEISILLYIILLLLFM